ncbi:TRAP transporter substrate-binding protein DctP [Vulcanococcus limneticus]|uniref:TRAP transporter substrate-binding protein DctP n=1 Tax=Vulcanococcus limneticus TaxID=2170428 RepID=UPI00398BE1A1
MSIGSVFYWAWRIRNTIDILVLGQPQSVGRLQAEKEVPFFHTLAARTGLPLSIAYIPANAFGLKDNYQLEALRVNRIGLASLRFMQNTAAAPALEGIDLPGMVSTAATARQVTDAYSPWLDHELHRLYGIKLLGIWSFGPQVLFCRSSIASLKDIKGRPVRVASSSLAQIIRGLGGVPAVIPFDDTETALRAQIVDCAVTSAASAMAAGWTDHTNYYLPLPMHYGLNGYTIGSQVWSKLSSDQQQQLARSFAAFNAELWRFSEELRQESERCLSTGRCSGSTHRRLIRVEPTRDDVKLLHQISRHAVIPAWLARCEAKHPGCRRAWTTTVAPILTTADIGKTE